MTDVPGATPKVDLITPLDQTGAPLTPEAFEKLRDALQKWKADSTYIQILPCGGLAWMPFGRTPGDPEDKSEPQTP